MGCKVYVGCALKIVPRVTRLGHLIVPSGRTNWVVAGDQRAECPARLINGMIHLADFEGVSGAKRHCWRIPIETVGISNGVGRVAPDFAKTKTVRATNITGAAQGVSNPLICRPVRAAGNSYGRTGTV